MIEVRDRKCLLCGRDCGYGRTRVSSRKYRGGVCHEYCFVLHKARLDLLYKDKDPHRSAIMTKFWREKQRND